MGRAAYRVSSQALDGPAYCGCLQLLRGHQLQQRFGALDLALGQLAEDARHLGQGRLQRVEAANKARLDRGPCRDEDLVLHFTPNMLRHAKATQIRREAGPDAARAVLGHRTPIVTEVYAELDEAKAAEIMARLG